MSKIILIGRLSPYYFLLNLYFLVIYYNFEDTIERRYIYMIGILLNENIRNKKSTIDFLSNKRNFESCTSCPMNANMSGYHSCGRVKCLVSNYKKEEHNDC